MGMGDLTEAFLLIKVKSEALEPTGS